MLIKVLTSTAKSTNKRLCELGKGWIRFVVNQLDPLSFLPVASVKPWPGQGTLKTHGGQLSVV